MVAALLVIDEIEVQRKKDRLVWSDAHSIYFQTILKLIDKWDRNPNSRLCA